MNDAAAPWPVRLRYHKDRRILDIAFDDGRTFELSAELLRTETPSAERRGHGNAEPKLVSGKRNVAITAIEPVGNYAVRIVFDDGHDSGFYDWGLLRHLGEAAGDIWSAYLSALAARGLSRER